MVPFTTLKARQAAAFCTRCRDLVVRCRGSCEEGCRGPWAGDDKHLDEHLDRLPCEKDVVSPDVLWEKPTGAGYCCNFWEEQHHLTVVNGDEHVLVRSFLPLKEQKLSLVQVEF